ncbi:MULTISPECIES: monovalent cation/H(+) antiporter subunit G [unclassified Frankia]|uniref:monovalent cation/H(+) antiporter subunit G n=1 Tax=unclassified Frankia TaxID=2632575 RepID=UPI0009FAE54F|nr:MULTISPECIES: monovalent cation/H(+) antiporter subunit G [unclassified Frankia]
MARQVICAVLLLVGSVFCVLGAWGLLRFPDVPSRLQAATKPQTVGLVAILLGSAVLLPFRFAVGLLLVALLQLVTAPVIAQRVGRAAYRTGCFRHDLLVMDDLARHREQQAAAADAAGDHRTGADDDAPRGGPAEPDGDGHQRR